MNPRTRKKLVATANRREGVYNRTGEPSVTFATEEEQQRECALTFVKKSEQAIHSLLRRGRDDKIRTCGLCVPNAALYQTEPHPVKQVA